MSDELAKPLALSPERPGKRGVLLATKQSPCSVATESLVVASASAFSGKRKRTRDHLTPEPSDVAVHKSVARWLSARAARQAGSCQLLAWGPGPAFPVRRVVCDLAGSLFLHLSAAGDRPGHQSDSMGHLNPAFWGSRANPTELEFHGRAPVGQLEVWGGTVMALIKLWSWEVSVSLSASSSVCLFVALQNVLFPLPKHRRDCLI